MKNILYLIRYLKGEHRRLGGVLAINLLRGLIFVTIPIIFKNIIDQITKAASKPSSGAYKTIGLSLLLLAAAYLTEQALIFWNEKISDTVRMSSITTLRNRIFPKLLSLSVDFTERNKPGELVQRVNQGIFDFMEWLWTFNEWLSTVIFSTILILIILVSKSLLVGGIFLIACPAMVYLCLRKVKKAKKDNETANRYYEQYAGQLSESISHLSTIKSLSAEGETNKLFQRYTKGILDNRLKQFKIQRRHNGARDTIGSLAMLLSISIVAVLAIKGKYTAGDIFLIAFYARDLTNSMPSIGRFIDTTGDTNITSGRLVTLLNTKPSFVDIEGAVDLPSIDALDFQNVSFTYPDVKKGAVSNINFDLQPGKTIALVGPSGVGKSTITKLLLRFYLPDGGNFSINGDSADKYTQESIRRKMAIVMQDVALFNTSVIENLKLAKPDASESEVIKAAKLAHAHEFIAELPNGYKTLVGERGIKLSGGQKQRIAIARAILKDPDLIILDEATSALDSQSEQLVQQGIRELLKGRMAIIIAHRLSTVRHADEILVLEKGQIEERGTHGELIRHAGLYKKLFDMQSATGKIEL